MSVLRPVMDSLERIGAILLRHFYLLSGSWIRLVDIIYWPALQMILWGFITQSLMQQMAGGGTAYYVVGTLLGAVLLWDVMMRVQIGMAFAYFEEIWSRNLGHLFVSPLRPWEWWAAMMSYSLLRCAAGMVPAMILAVWFYDYNIATLGWPLFGFIINLTMMGWWLGFLMTALLLRAGPGAEMVVWAITFLLAPVCAVYYPISVLPDWLQTVARAIPAAHVFEGLRAVAVAAPDALAHFVRAGLLNLVYMVIGAAVLRSAFNSARHRGTLFQTGE